MKIPIKIHPAYWIFTGILSFLLADLNPLQALLWMGIIFISVLFHELGHALTAKWFGRAPRIELVAMGGVTYHDGDRLPFWKQFLITLDGPIFGLILGLAAAFFHSFATLPAIKTILLQISVVNIFWTLVNLVPVLPLDGGQLLRIGLEKWFGFKGLRYTFLVSSLLALLASLAFFAMQNLLAGAIFFLFAFENFTNFRKSRYMGKNDRKDELKTAFIEGEKLFVQGKKQEALIAFQAIRDKTESGMLYDGATQYVALILASQGRGHEAYELLKSLQDRLDPPALLLLHELSFEHKDDVTAGAIGASVFQLYPAPEVALRNAYTAARFKQTSAAIGWLRSALKAGVENLAEIVREADFDLIRDEAEFQEFVQELFE